MRKTAPGAAICSIRAARLTVSPNAVKSIDRSSLMLPTTTPPVFRPTRNSGRTPNAPPSSSATVANSACISSAAVAAATSARSWAIGAPNNAMIPSPRNCVTIPP